MKKQVYMKPTMQVVTFNSMTLLVGSVVGSSVSNTEATGNALSRGHRGGWDDDDEY